MYTATVRRSCMLPISAPTIWELLLQTETLRKITEGYMTYHGDLPKQWEVGQEIDIKPKFAHGLLSYLPPGRHMVIVKQVDPNRFLIETVEAGGVVKYWNHVMKIEPAGDQFCKYSDTVVIHARWATNIVANLADDLYRHRQAKWHELAVELLKDTALQPA